VKTELKGTFKLSPRAQRRENIEKMQADCQISIPDCVDYLQFASD
jgi:hypothetical protein